MLLLKEHLNMLLVAHKTGERGKLEHFNQEKPVNKGMSLFQITRTRLDKRTLWHLSEIEVSRQGSGRRKIRNVDASGGDAGTNLERNADLEKDEGNREEEGAQNISTVKYQQNRSRESWI